MCMEVHQIQLLHHRHYHLEDNKDMTSNARNLANLLVAGETQISVAKLGNDVAPGTEDYSSVDSLGVGTTIGETAFVQSSNRMYIWNGSGWYNIALINTSPTWDAGGQPAGSYALDADSPQDVTTITLSASDPEGLPITYTYVASGQMDSMATISQDSSVFTITPKTFSEVGSYDNFSGSITFRASDGVNILPQVSSFTLQFTSPTTIVLNSNYTAVLATAVSTGDNSTVTDSSTNNHAITVSGNAQAGTFSPYRHGGYSTYFDGAGDYIRYTDASLAEGTDDFTVEFWLKREGTQALNDTVVGHDTTPGWQVCFNSSNNLQFMSSTGDSSRVLSTGTLNAQQWYHVVYQRSSGTLQGFLDGVSLGTATVSDNFTNNIIEIGVNRGGTAFFNGHVRDVRIIKGTAFYSSSGFDVPTEPLTAVSGTGYSTTLLSCHLPYIADGGANSLTPTVNGNTLTKPFGPYDNFEYEAADHGGSIYLDGTDDRLSIANIGLSGDLTLEGWFYQSVAQSATFRCIISASTYASSAPLRIYTNGSDVRAYVNTTTYITGSFVANTWNHLALVRTSGTWTLYINGQSTGTNTTSGSYDFDSTVDWTVGGDANGAYPFTGNVSDIRFTNSAVYSSNFTPPTTPLSSTGASLSIKGTDASVIDKAQRSSTIILGGTSGTSTSQIKFANTVSIYSDGNSGNGSIVRVPLLESTGTHDFTLEFWYYGLVGSAGAYSGVLAGGSSTGAFKGVMISHDNWWLGSNSGNASIPNSSGKISNNTWQHLAVTRSSGTVYAYKDGVYFGTTTSSMDLDTTEYTLFSRYANSTSWMTSGFIQDFRLTNGLARYSGTSNFTPPTEPLKG